MVIDRRKPTLEASRNRVDIIEPARGDEPGTAGAGSLRGLAAAAAGDRTAWWKSLQRRAVAGRRAWWRQAHPT
jgi:hypothetical protein